MSLENLSTEELSQQILDRLPQKNPFRYLDRIIEIDQERIVGQYTFKQDEWFYQGHFPGQPVTPGVILIEAMAQTSVVALGIYLLMAGGEDPDEYLTMFTDVDAEFYKEVKPGSVINVKAEKLFFRRKKLKAKADLYLEDGTLAASATLSGLGVKK